MIDRTKKEQCKEILALRLPLELKKALSQSAYDNNRYLAQEVRHRLELSLKGEKNLKA